MGISLRKKTFLRKRSRKRKRKIRRKRKTRRKKLNKRSRKIPFSKKGKKNIKKKGKRRKSKNYKMRGGGVIVRGNPGVIVVGGTPNEPPPLTTDVSYSPWFLPRASTSIVIGFRNNHGGWDATHLYGTSLPDQTHKCDGIVGCRAGNPGLGVRPGARMYRTMGYFMYGKGVNKWVSFQACGSRAVNMGHPHRSLGHPHRCQGDPNAEVGTVERNRAKAENHTWRSLRALNPQNLANDDIQMLDVLINDMAVGKIHAWVWINYLGGSTGFGDPQNSAVFHCYMGLGRTGSAFLFYVLRNNMRLGDIVNLSNRWLGQGSSANMYNLFFSELQSSLSRHCCHRTNPIAAEPLLPARVNIFDPIRIVRETMEYGAARGPGFSANLLISRVNTIIVMMWYYFYMQPDRLGSCAVANRVARGGANWNRVYLYNMSISPGWVGAQPLNFTPALLFSQPHPHRINMAHCFQAGGLPHIAGVPHPVSVGLPVPLGSFRDYFGIRFI